MTRTKKALVGAGIGVIVAVIHGTLSGVLYTPKGFLTAETIAHDFAYCVSYAVVGGLIGAFVGRYKNNVPPK